MDSKDKFKILLAASIYPPDPGGPALHVKAFEDWLRGRGQDYDVVKLSKLRLVPFGLRHIIYTYLLFKKAKDCDVIYGYDVYGVGLPAWLVAKLRRKKLIIRVGGDIPWERSSGENKTDLSMKEWYRAEGYKKNFSYKVTRFVMRRTDRLIVPSSLLSELYISYYNISSEKLVVIPNPVPKSKEGYAPYSEPRTFIFASRLVAYKNLSFVLDSLSHVFPDYPEIKFLIMGDGPESDRLKAKTRALGIGKQVVFSGKISQEEVEENTVSCYAGLAPALTEFNPNYILQCLSYGKPFLISNENGLPFRVPDNLTFDPRSQLDFENKLRMLLEQESYNQARKWAEENNFHMSWDDVFEANNKIIKAL